MIRILFVGAGLFPIYEKAFYDAAQKIEGVQAELFTWTEDIESILNVIIRKAQNKLAIGPHITKINRKLIKYCETNKFDIVFFYTCRLIFADTVKRVKEMGSYVAVYNNDDPFADYFPKYFWRHYKRSIQYSDITYVYRSMNKKLCEEEGAKRVELLRSYYIAERNYYIPDEEITTDVPQVVFLGHMEKDERQEYVKALLEEQIAVGVPGDAWRQVEPDNPYLVKLEDTQRQYNDMLNKAKLAIVFLSKINRDTYTRRCFEIPAVKTLMVAPYTDDLANMFQENEEIVFYRSKEEFVSKIKYYLENEAEREKIALAGFKRVMQDGHEVGSRVKQILADYREYQ